MADDVTLNTFPATRVEALAYLYVQKKHYDNPTPTQLAEDYRLAYQEFVRYFTEHRERSHWS